MSARKKAQATWGGRFTAGPAELMLRFGESVSFDHRLWAQDIRGSKAHATMLAQAGIVARVAEHGADRDGQVLQQLAERGRLVDDARLQRRDAAARHLAHGMLGLSILTGLGSRSGILDGSAIAFLGIELYEFGQLIAEGASPQRSAFLSAFFTLVGTHGAHVAVGLIWLTVMLIQLGQHGLSLPMKRRLICLSMFWHFLDIIWIGVFTFVYLYGVIR